MAFVRVNLKKNVKKFNILPEKKEKKEMTFLWRYLYDS